jgi:hypothetical protein
MSSTILPLGRDLRLALGQRPGLELDDHAAGGVGGRGRRRSEGAEDAEGDGGAEAAKLERTHGKQLLLEKIEAGTFTPARGGVNPQTGWWQTPMDWPLA